MGGFCLLVELNRWRVCGQRGYPVYFINSLIFIHSIRVHNVVIIDRSQILPVMERGREGRGFWTILTIAEKEEYGGQENADNRLQRGEEEDEINSYSWQLTADIRQLKSVRWHVTGEEWQITGGYANICTIGQTGKTQMAISEVSIFVFSFFLKVMDKLNHVKTSD